MQRKMSLAARWGHKTWVLAHEKYEVMWATLGSGHKNLLCNPFSLLPIFPLDVKTWDNLGDHSLKLISIYHLESPNDCKEYDLSLWIILGKKVTSLV